MSRVRLLKVVGAGAALAALAGCGGDGSAADDAPTRDGPIVEDAGPIHVHGLGVNPADGALLIATHTGLFESPEGETQATRVADRYQDTMGFTVVGRGRFLGSGHPDGREGLPPFLGLIESSDAGRSWEEVSLQGDADFHVLEADDEQIYGFGTDFKSREEQLLVSGDGGREWSERRVPESLVALAIDPEDSNRLIASGARRLHGSTDGGRSWDALAGKPGLLTWASDDRLYRVTAAGTVAVSDDAGESWRVTGSVGGEPAAFEGGAEGDLYAALHDGTISRSSDGGASWALRSRP